MKGSEEMLERQLRSETEKGQTEPAFVVFGMAEAEALKAELTAALERERGLRDDLAESQATLERELAGGKSFALRSVEVDDRAARVAALEAPLAKGERELVQRREAAVGEQQRLAELKGELQTAEQRQAERETQISVKFRELQASDRERTEASAELAKYGATIAQRERAVERAATEAEGLLNESTAQVQARESVLGTREAAFREQETQLAERDRALAERERDLLRVRAGVGAHEDQLETRGADLRAALDRLAAEQERLAGERLDAGTIGAGAIARSAEMGLKESELAAREAELNRRESRVRRDESAAKTERSSQRRRIGSMISVGSWRRARPRWRARRPCSSRSAPAS